MQLSTTSTLVKLDNAGVNRSGRWLVRGITMQVDPGEIVTLIGPNGAGKTTAAKLALGVLNLDEGSAHQRKNLRVGYVPQKLAIDWTLPLRVTRFLRLTHKYSDKEIRSALDATGSLHLIQAEMRNLSGGAFQRVLLSRAIIKSPELLVLDEPVQGVDHTGEAALYELIERIGDSLNCGILLISHDLHFVMSATNRVICLNGHVCCSGTPKDVSNSSEFKSLYGQQISASLALYNHIHDHSHALDGTIESREKNSERRI